MDDLIAKITGGSEVCLMVESTSDRLLDDFVESLQAVKGLSVKTGSRMTLPKENMMVLSVRVSLAPKETCKQDQLLETLKNSRLPVAWK